MKQNLARLVIAFGGVVGASALAAAFAVGCGGDDNEGVSPDAGDEQHVDVLPDGPVVDAGDGGDPADASDGNVRDVSCEAAPAMVDFPRAADEAFCGHMRDCCLVEPSKWDQTACVELYASIGGFQYYGRYSDTLDAGNIEYDQCKAAYCIDDLQHLFCGKFTSADLMAIREQCNSAFKGQVPSGGDCKASIQCQQGLFCRSEDGGMGKCVPLLGPDQTCKQYGNEACSYLGLGLESSPYYCDIFRGDSGVCKPALANDAGCWDNVECKSGTCAPTGEDTTCVSEVVVADPGVPAGFCDYFTIKDAAAD